MNNIRKGHRLPKWTCIMAVVRRTVSACTHSRRNKGSNSSYGLTYREIRTRGHHSSVSGGSKKETRKGKEKRK